jgi:hypothetical protein
MKKGKSVAGVPKECVEKAIHDRQFDDEKRPPSQSSEGEKIQDSRDVDPIQVHDNERSHGFSSGIAYRGSSKPEEGGFGGQRVERQSPPPWDGHHRIPEFGFGKYSGSYLHGNGSSFSPKFSRGKEYDFSRGDYSGHGREFMYGGRETKYRDRRWDYKLGEYEGGCRHIWTHQTI